MAMLDQRIRTLMVSRKSWPCLPWSDLWGGIRNLLKKSWHCRKFQVWLAEQFPLQNTTKLNFKVGNLNNMAHIVSSLPVSISVLVLYSWSRSQLAVLTWCHQCFKCQSLEAVWARCLVFGQVGLVISKHGFGIDDLGLLGLERTWFLKESVEACLDVCMAPWLRSRFLLLSSVVYL